MHRDRPLLCVHTRSEHTRRTEQHPDTAIVHGTDDRLFRFLRLGFLYEAYLMSGNTVILYQFPFNLAIHAPLSRLVSPQIREYELCPFLFVIPVIVFGNQFGAMARLVVRMVFVVRAYHTHIQCHLTGIIRGDEHLGFLFGFRQFLPAEYRGIARLGKLHQLLYELFLLRCRRNVMQYLVIFRTIHAHVLRRAVVRYLIIEHSQLRHFDKIAEAFFLNDVVSHIKFKIGCLLGKNSSPRIKATNILPLQFFRTKVFEQQVQFRQRVADGRARQECSPQVLSRPFLNGTDGIKHIESLLASFLIAQSGDTAVPRVEHQVLELVAFVHEDMVDAHLLEIRHVIRAVFYGVCDLFQLGGKVELAHFQPLQHCS